MFNLTPQSKADLHKIWIYSVEIWGEFQADKYITALYNRFEWLANNADLGKHRPDIKEGYYCFLQNSHLIFYTKSQDSINIIGIPHKSMDIVNYFSPSIH